MQLAPHLRPDDQMASAIARAIWLQGKHLWCFTTLKHVFRATHSHQIARAGFWSHDYVTSTGVFGRFVTQSCRTKKGWSLSIVRNDRDLKPVLVTQSWLHNPARALWSQILGGWVLWGPGLLEFLRKVSLQLLLVLVFCGRIRCNCYLS